jgi:hypothetical protein
MLTYHRASRRAFSSVLFLFLILSSSSFCVLRSLHHFQLHHLILLICQVRSRRVALPAGVKNLSTKFNSKCSTPSSPSANFSSVSRRVSGTRREVATPHSIKREKICMTWLSQGAPVLECELYPRLAMGAKTTWAMIAPTLPEAAEKPCAVARKRVGKHSAGIMKVVALGPEWKKG